MHSKETLREHYKQVLSRISSEERINRSQQLATAPKFLPELLAAKSVLSFISLDDEISTKKLNQELWASGRKLYVPLLIDNSEMTYVAYTPATPLVASPLGFLQPDIGEDTAKNELVAASLATGPQLDTILVPGLAFSSDGGRLGRGKGFYDRFIAQYETKLVRPLVKLGIGFREQLHDSNSGVFPQDPWDIKMNGLVLV